MMCLQPVGKTPFIPVSRQMHFNLAVLQQCPFRGPVGVSTAVLTHLGGAHAVFVVGPAPLSVSQTVHRANMNKVGP